MVAGGRRRRRRERATERSATSSRISVAWSLCLQGRYAKAEAQRGLLRPAGRSVPSSTTRGLEAKMRAAREAATAQATNDMINRAAQMASDLSDPSRSIRGSQAGRFVVHSALPPVGQKPVAPEVVQPRVSVPEHSLSGLDDAAYLEVMEQDILAAQAQILSALAIRGAPDIRSREAAVPGAPSHATRSFTERDLADRRNLGATAAKLQLHEILNEKLRQLERIALVEHATVEGVHGPQLSRLPSLMALLKLAGGAAGRGGSAPEASSAAPASSAAEAAEAAEAARAAAEERAAAATARATAAEEAAAALNEKVRSLEASNSALRGAAERESSSLDRASAAEARMLEYESRALAMREEATALRATLKSREAAASRPGSARGSAPSAAAAAAVPPPPPMMPVLDLSANEGGSSRSDAVEAKAEVEAMRASAASAEGALRAEVETLRARLEAAEPAASEAHALRAALDAEVNAREAAERSAAASARESELLRRAAGGDESFEAALASELCSMREAYEARLKAAADAAREMQASHRKELSAVHAAGDRVRRAFDAAAASPGSRMMTPRR